MVTLACYLSCPAFSAGLLYYTDRGITRALYTVPAAPEMCESCSYVTGGRGRISPNDRCARLVGPTPCDFGASFVEGLRVPLAWICAPNLPLTGLVARDFARNTCTLRAPTRVLVSMSIFSSRKDVCRLVFGVSPAPERLLYACIQTPHLRMYVRFSTPISSTKTHACWMASGPIRNVIIGGVSLHLTLGTLYSWGCIQPYVTSYLRSVSMCSSTDSVVQWHRHQF